MFWFGSKKTSITPTDRLWQLLGDHGIFMLTTQTVSGDDAVIRSRPMAGYPSQQERRIWFLTDEKGMKDEEIHANKHVCITLSDPSKQHFVSASGRASFHNDVERKKQLWSVASQAWFPEGPEDPAVLLVCVDLDQAEFWDGDPNPMLVCIKMAKAAASGERVEVGENEKVNLRLNQPDEAEKGHGFGRTKPDILPFYRGF